MSRTERNEHLETHFIHRNCKHCSRQVIVIGDLEFELHHPIHCKGGGTIREDVFETNDLLFEESSQIESPKYDEEISEHDSSQLKDAIKSEESCDDGTAGSENSTVVTNIDIQQNIQRKRQKRIASQRNHSNKRQHTHLQADEFIANSKSATDTEDDVVKEMDVAIKKRRKKYAKLPKTVPCTMCDAMFGTERTLKIHLNQVHGIKERYICPICSREFKIGGNLKQHIETHSDYKRFICNYCGKGFHLPYNLKEHMNTHTGAR